MELDIGDIDAIVLDYLNTSFPDAAKVFKKKPKIVKIMISFLITLCNT